MITTLAVLPAADRKGATRVVETKYLPGAARSEIDRACWRELASLGAASAPFIDGAWIDAWIEAYRPREPLLLGAWANGLLVGLAPLQRSTDQWAGRSVSVLSSLTNVESPRFDFLSADIEVAEQLWRTLCTSGTWGSWDVIHVHSLPADSPTLRAGLSVARELGWTPVVIEHFPSPWRPLPAAAQAWDEGLARKFKSNLRNRERRLQALGPVELEFVKGLDIFYELEASGWKASAGTAIAMRKDAKALYDGLAARAGDRMWLPVLRVAGRPIAAQVVYIADSTAFMLKTAYHPDFSTYAPSQLLTARLMQHAITQGMEALDFLGDPMTWKADWAPRLRPHCQLLLFAPSGIGRYAYWTRYGVREQIKRVPGARRLAAYMRARGSDSGLPDSR